MRHRFALFETSTAQSVGNGASLRKPICLNVVSYGFLEAERLKRRQSVATDREAVSRVFLFTFLSAQKSEGV